jgi:hypothetical protein
MKERNMHKKLLFALLVGILILAACGGTPAQTTEGNTSGDTMTGDAAPLTDTDAQLTAIAQTQVATPQISSALPTAEQGALVGDPCPAEFTDSFDEASECWSVNAPLVITSRDSEAIAFSITRGELAMQLGGEETYAYTFYSNDTYEDVVLQATYTNRGVNRNGLALVCYANAEGWVEFRINNGGTFAIYRYDAAAAAGTGNPYTEYVSGGDPAIQVGQRENTVLVSCIGDDLGLTVNGTGLWADTVDLGSRAYGMVGLGAMSFDVVPVDLRVQDFAASLP